MWKLSGKNTTFNQCLLQTQGSRWSRVFSSSAREVPWLAEMPHGAREHIYSQRVSWPRHPSYGMEEESFSTDDGTLGADMRINEQGPDSKPHTKWPRISIGLSIISH